MIGYYKAGQVDGLCKMNAKVIYGDTDSVMVKFGVGIVCDLVKLFCISLG